MAIVHSFKALCFCITIITFLAPFTLAAGFAEGAGEPNDPNQGAVTIELTKLDVNDTTLELHYKIKNNTDHDVWICDSVNIRSTFNFEVYLAEDDQTLVIRKRLDVPSRAIWRIIPAGSYIILRQGEDRTESLSLNLPVQSRILYSSQGRTQVTRNARCLALEIGFYDEDLPALIRSIIIEADKFSGTFDADWAIKKEYFRGLQVRGCLGGLNSFYEINKDPYSEGQVVINYSYQAFTGEKVLRIEVDNVSIPYEGYVQSRSNAESNNDPNNYEEKVVTIELNKLDVNDTNLELQYKIKNNTDHDVWICDDIHVYGKLDCEVYLAEDEQSLLVRRRLDVPTAVVWVQVPYGRYVLLRSGQERTESLSLAVPVRPRCLFASGRATSDHARRLVLEIGFYNEDLPEMIRDILEMAEKLNCASLEPSEYRTAFFMRYFKGIWIAHRLFGGLSDFEEYTYKEGSEQIEIPYTWQNFNGEQVLRIEVDGVHIPYEEVLTSHAGNKSKDVQSQQMSSRNKDKSDREKTSERNDTDKS